MRRWLAVASVAGLCAAAPLFAPQAWAQHGAFPDVAALAVLYLAITATPERAAVMGMVIGLARSLWSSDPVGLDAALYGGLGWSGAQFGRAVFDDRLLVKMCAAAAGVVALRALAAGAAFVTSAGDGGPGLTFLTWAAATAAAAFATAIAAPVAFTVLSVSRVFAPLERGSRRDV
jgi:rod shape-determining protein MreD